jgi:bifunctional non-homologous end joining protein LigD
MYGRDGKPSFEQLGVRLANAKRARFWVDRVPATYVAFDLLRLDSTDLMAKPWEERRAALVGLSLDGAAGPWRVNPAYDDGDDLLAVTGTMGLEGVVAKHRRSPYRRGSAPAGGSYARTCDRRGWTSSAGSRPGGQPLGCLSSARTAVRPVSPSSPFRPPNATPCSM